MIIIPYDKHKIGVTMQVGITFGTFDLLHAGHVLMLEEARSVCDYLIVGLQIDPSLDRVGKNSPVQTLVERQIQLKACRHVDEVIVYGSESELENILKSLRWDIRIIGSEYKNIPFTGKDYTYDRCHFNNRQHTFSSSELRRRVALDEHNLEPPEPNV